MKDFSDVTVATRAVMDPSTSEEDIDAIAQEQPDLWTAVAIHPNAHPELLAWLAQNGDAAVLQALAARQMQVDAGSVKQKRSHHPWIIAVVVLVILVAISVVLMVLHPWQSRPEPVTSSPSSSELTADQFAWMLLNNPHFTLNSDLAGMTPAGVAAQIAQQQPGDWTVADPSKGSCAQQINDAASSIVATIELTGDSSSDANIDQVILFPSADSASTFAQNFYTACGDTESDPVQTGEQSGVSFVGAFYDFSYDTFDESYAQYGNVVFWTQAGQTGLTWTQWQGEAPELKQAVDDAAGH